MAETVTSNPNAFFILGRARSGTTLLRSMLDSHPQVLVPPECAFLNNLYSKYHKNIFRDKKTIEKFYSDLISQPSFGYLNIDTAKLKDSLLMQFSGKTYGDICKIVYLHYRAFAPKEQIRLIGDKNPHYSLFIPRLRKIYPESRFIHLIRDPRGNVQSMLSVDFESHIVSSLAWRWKYYNRKIEKEKSKIPEQFITVKYEDLAAEPEKHLRLICSFLKIDFNPAMLEFHKYKSEVIKVYPQKAVERYHSNLFKPVNTSRTDVWKTVFTPRQIKTIAAVCGQFAARYGYETVNKTGLIVSFLFAIPGITYGWLYMLWGNFLSALPFGLKMFVIRLLAKIFKPWWKRHEMGKVDVMM